MNEDLTHEQLERFEASLRAGDRQPREMVRAAMTITHEDLLKFASVFYDPPSVYIEAFEKIGLIVEPEPIEVPQNVIDAAVRAYDARETEDHESSIERAIRAAYIAGVNAGK